MNRRNFIKNTSLTLSSISVVPSFLNEELDFCKKKTKMGLQMYTLRNDFEKDLPGTLHKIAELGYTTLELAGYDEGKIYGATPVDFKRMLMNEGLKVVSGHVLTGRQLPNKPQTMVNDFERVIDDMKAIGQKYIVCAWLFPEERSCLDDYKKLAVLLDKCAEKCQKYGIVFAYHNHDFEFDPINTLIPYDILLRETDADLVKFEMDMYWMKKANQNPVKYFEKYPNRFPLWHVKDMNKKDPSKFAEVGQGSIDFASLFANKEKAGLKYFFVEQDDCYERAPMDSIKMSFDYLKTQNFFK